MSQSLQNADVIGIDVEWRPDTLNHRSPASIVQVKPFSAPSLTVPADNVIADRI